MSMFQFFLRAKSVSISALGRLAMRTSRAVVVFIAITANSYYATVHAEGIDVGSLPAVRKVVVKANADIRRNRKIYDEANEKVFTEAEKALRMEVDRLSKAGMPEEAVAVKKFLADFRQSVVKSAEAAETARLVPAGQEFARSLVGRWDGEGTSYVSAIDADGRVTEYKKPAGTINARGKITVIQPQQVTVELENKYVLQFRAKNDGTCTCTVLDPSGKVFEESVVRRVE